MDGLCGCSHEEADTRLLLCDAHAAYNTYSSQVLLFVHYTAVLDFTLLSYWNEARHQVYPLHTVAVNLEKKCAWLWWDCILSLDVTQRTPSYRQRKENSFDTSGTSSQVCSNDFTAWSRFSSFRGVARLM